MDDPRTLDIREWYLIGRRTHNPFSSDADLVAPFDRWLREHDSETWQDGADAAYYDPESRDLVSYPDNPHLCD